MKKEKKKFIPALVSTISFSRKVKVADIKKYLVDEYKLTDTLNKENKNLRKELDKAEETKTAYDLTLVTLDEYKKRLNEKDEDIKDLNKKINTLKSDISKLNEEKNTLIIKNRDVDKYAEKKVEECKKELISKITDFKAYDFIS
jgi:chromosome segregation ATPase